MTYVWAEKYRPQTIEEFLCRVEDLQLYKSWIRDKQIPHLMLSGQSGIGKTTLAKILIDEIPCDSLFINASDKNNIETVRTTINDFASSAGFHSLKIIVLDEFDGFTPEGQKALRSLIDEFTDTTRFILTCNYPERVIPAIMSRVTTIQFASVPPAVLAKTIVNILTTEGIKFELSDVKKVFSAHYPDLRKILNELQLHSSGGELVVPETLQGDDVFNAIISVLKKSETKTNKLTEIRKLLANNDIRNFIPLYQSLYKNCDIISSSPEKVPLIIIAISKGLSQDVTIPDKEINAMSTICEILEINY